MMIADAALVFFCWCSFIITSFSSRRTLLQNWCNIICGTCTALWAAPSSSSLAPQRIRSVRIHLMSVFYKLGLLPRLRPSAACLKIFRLEYQDIPGLSLTIELKALVHGLTGRN